MQAVLRCHKKWENEKMFGKWNLSMMGMAMNEFQYFTTNKLISKFSNQQVKNNNIPGLNKGDKKQTS